MKTNSILSTTVAALLALATAPAISQAVNLTVNSPTVYTVSGTETYGRVIQNGGTINIDPSTSLITNGTVDSGSQHPILIDGTVNVQGGTLTNQGGETWVGWNGQGFLNVTSGNVNFDAKRLVIYFGQVNLSGGTVTSTAQSIKLDWDNNPSIFGITGGLANLRGVEFANDGAALNLSAGELDLGVGGIFRTGGSATLNFTGGILKLSGNGAINTPFSVGTPTVDQLWIGGVAMAAGTWGRTGSGADNINDTYFGSNMGTQKLTVVTGVPEPCTAVSLLGGLGMLLGLRRRRE